MTLAEFVEKYNLTMRLVRIPENPFMPEFKGNHFHVTLAYTIKGRRITTYFSTGTGWKFPPKIVDVLECLHSDASNIDQPFEDWANDLGYDVDSRKAFKIYEACQDQANKLNYLVGHEAFKEFLAVERD